MSAQPELTPENAGRREGLIEERDVSDVAVCSLLAAREVAFNIDASGDVYVTGLEFPFWVLFDAERKFLFFNSYIDVAPDRAAELLEQANWANSQIFMLSVAYMPNTNRMSARHFISYTGGLLASQFYELAWRFAGSFRLLASELGRRGLLTD